MHRLKKAIGAMEIYKKEKTQAYILTISEQRHILLNLYTYDRDIALKLTTEDINLHQLCKSLTTREHKISEKTWKKVAAAMRDEQAKHSEGGPVWHNDPWLPREYTSKLVKKAWSHLTSDDIESLHSFGGFNASAYLDQFVPSSYSCAEPPAVPNKDVDIAVIDSWADELSDSDSSYEEISEDAIVTPLSPAPSQKSKSLSIPRERSVNVVEDFSLQKRMTGPSFRARMEKLQSERANNR
jgi:hypothetical protein